MVVDKNNKVNMEFKNSMAFVGMTFGEDMWYPYG